MLEERGRTTCLSNLEEFKIQYARGKYYIFETSGHNSKLIGLLQHYKAITCENMPLHIMRIHPIEMQTDIPHCKRKYEIPFNDSRVNNPNTHTPFKCLLPTSWMYMCYLDG